MTRKQLLAIATLTLVGCSDQAPLPPSDDPTAILGQYTLSSVNGLAVSPPAELTPTLSVGSGWVWLYADRSYRSSYQLYTKSGPITTGTPHEGAGGFRLNGTALAFDASAGFAPVSAAVQAPNLRVVMSVSAGRAPDTLVFQLQTVTCPTGC